MWLFAAEEWLEVWWLGLSRGPRAGEQQWQVFKHEAWYQVVSMLCRVIKNPHLEVRPHPLIGEHAGAHKGGCDHGS